jgi:hypothetical protein
MLNPYFFEPYRELENRKAGLNEKNQEMQHSVAGF